jgi:hypothetical protein
MASQPWICSDVGVNGSPYTIEEVSTSTFCDGFFKIGSHELFAQAGIEPQSS